MNLIDFEKNINRSDWHWRSPKLHAVVRAVRNVISEGTPRSRDLLLSAFCTWQYAEPNEFRARGEWFKKDMREAILEAPLGLFQQMIKIGDPNAHPAWKPEKWEAYKLKANCYAYACDHRPAGTERTKHDPGDYYLQNPIED